MRARTRLVLFGLALTVIPSGAAGDEWLTFRHDARRTGASSGSAAIDRPTVHWRRYLGGQLSPTQLFAADVDDDGTTEVVYVAGGRAIAKRPDNLIVWESPLLALTYIAAMTDLDRDGAREVLAVGQAGYVFLLSGRDGSVLWENPRGPIGTVGAVRVADLDGDGSDDLYIAECRCCTIHGSSAGVAYGFSGGFGAATELWTLGPGVGGCSANDQIADVDGDGSAEIVIANQLPSMQIVDARTGLVRWNVPAPASGSFYPSSTIFPANLDADPADELVVVSNGYQASGGNGARRIAVWDYTAADTITLLWEATAPDRVSDSVYSAIDAMGDLDGDGAAEVAFTIEASGDPRVELRDAISGAVRATLPSAALRGAVDLDADGRAELIVAEGGAVAAYRVTGAGLERAWSLPDRTLVRYLDHARWVSDANATVPLALDLDDDPALELVVAGTDASGQSALFAIDAGGATTAELGRFAADEGVSILVSSLGASLTRARDQVMTVTSDGYLIVLDERMQPTNRVLGEIPLPGMRVGGYYSGPNGLGQTAYVAELDAPSVIVRDSRPALIRLDARAATPSAPPAIVWERFGAAWPLIADLDGDGARDLAVMENGGVVALDASASTELWRAPGVLAGGPLSDLIPAQRSGGTDILLSRSQAGSVMEGLALDGASGALRWAPFSRALNWGYIAPAAGDLTGDGVDDLVTVTNSTLVLDGASGALVNDNATFVAYALPMLFDANGDGSTDAWVHGGYFADRLLSSSMATLAVRSDHTSPHTGSWGALVSCAGEPAVVSGAFESAELWTVRPRDAAPLAHRALVEGEVFDPSAVPAGRRGGFLGNVTSVAALSTTHGPAVLVGSTDGYLYALEPCTLAPIWALELRYPVGEPVIADANGDGVDDLLVSCADGFLYGVGDAALEAPASVRDVDPASATPDADVDAVDTLGTLWAQWDAVAGATSYQIGVFTASGSEARFPNFRDVGNVTSAELTELPLRLGQRYYVSVIPLGPDGPGLEASSDGVVITDTLGPTATITVAPTPAWPAGGAVPAVSARCADRVALASMRVEIGDTSGAVLRVLADGPASGTSFSSNEPWDGALDAGGEAPAGYYVAIVTCTDREGRTARAEAELVLDPSAVGETDGGVIMRDGGTEPLPPPGGCGCRAGGSGVPSSGWLLALGALVVGARRRRGRDVVVRA